MTVVWKALRSRCIGMCDVRYFMLFRRSGFLIGLFLGNDMLQSFPKQNSVYSDTGRETKSVCPKGNLFSKSTG
jgi:hypothetical protein